MRFKLGWQVTDDHFFNVMGVIEDISVNYSADLEIYEISLAFLDIAQSSEVYKSSVDYNAFSINANWLHYSDNINC